MIATGDPEDRIAERMQEVRRRGHANAYHLRQGVDRASDWKEHVKAYPLAAGFASVVVGYWVATKIFGSKSSSSASSNVQPRADNATQDHVAKSTAAAGVAAFAGSVVTNLVRQYAKGYIDNYIHRLTHKES